MNIYLIRHGIAEKISPGKKDRERSLTEEGRQKLAAGVELWKKHIKHFDVIYTSPYLRAVQSSEIISKVFGYNGNITQDSTLAPGSLTDDLLELANHSDKKEIAFVGHQPDMSDHIAVLVDGTGSEAVFKEGSIAKISFNGIALPGKGQLEFLIP